MAYSTIATSFPTRPSLVEWVNWKGKKLRFLIMDCPRKHNLPDYLKEFQKYHVRVCVRACDKTYSSEEVEKTGVQMAEMNFEDGGVPPLDIVKRWLDIVDSTFPSSKNDMDKSTIAVHCVAGLGRAPLLVAIALIENGMDPMQAVEYIRERRRGAINRKQLACLEQYHRIRSRNRNKSRCSIM